MGCLRVAINGFGRIGRLIYRLGYKEKDIEWVAVNDLASPEALAHLLEYDSVYGKLGAKISVEKNSIFVDGKELRIFNEKDPAALPWKDLKIDVVIESTGRFTKKEDAEKHISAGAKKVLLSAPAKSAGFKTIVLGVNDSSLSSSDVLVSNASCTTNCFAPIAKVLEDSFGIEKGFLSTVHSYTSDQNLLDSPHKDLRRARSAAINIIPTSTGAAIAVSEVIPSLRGKMDGVSFRVPTPVGSIIDFVCVTKRPVTIEEVNSAVRKAAEGKMKGIVEYSEKPLVSTDIIGNAASSIFDSKLTNVIGGNLVKVVSWYDNETGFSRRMIDMVKRM
ncbi:MAG: type I glyceraldehyde-3-phosphate dehydrogenase [archaeon]